VEKNNLKQEYFSAKYYDNKIKNDAELYAKEKKKSNGLCEE
jgi:hypothetical protein